MSQGSEQAWPFSYGIRYSKIKYFAKMKYNGFGSKSLLTSLSNRHATRNSPLKTYG